MLNMDDSREQCTVTLHRSTADDALLRRVRSEFGEMPGMRLTIDQAMRLWAIDRPTCSALLGSLVAAHFLACDDYGRYRRQHGGY